MATWQRNTQTLNSRWQPGNAIHKHSTLDGNLATQYTNTQLWMATWQRNTQTLNSGGQPGNTIHKH